MPYRRPHKSKKDKSIIPGSTPLGTFLWQKIKRGFKKKGAGKRIFRRLLIVVGILIILGFIGLALAFLYYSKDLPSPDKINARIIPQSTRIYDRTGQVLLYEIHGDQNRTLIDFDEISDNIKKATVAVEDQDFYRHPGFDIRGILRVVWLFIKSGKIQGGSTITQQFIKNSILTPERTLARKIKEIILAIEMERKFSKDEILKMYLNEIPYGSNVYGIEQASLMYFGKRAKDLSIAEAATLASLPRAPTYYSPYGTHTKELISRQHWAIDRMMELGFITEDQRDQAKKEKLEFRKLQENIRAPHFVMYVREYLVEKYGEKMVQEEGLKVITTLDIQKQDLAESLVKEWVSKNIKSYNAHNAALVAIDPKTGQILAMVGSKDYFSGSSPKDCTPGKNCLFEPNVNVSIRNRQPGSSFKPFAYAEAFKKGYTPDTLLYDLITNFGGGYTPKNYDLRTRGPVTMKQGLAQSINIPSVKTLYLAGVNETIDLAKSMGITTLDEPERYGLSLVLGGGEVKLLDEVASFGVFANDGIKCEKTPILKVEDSQGKILEESKKEEGKRVLDAQIAQQINDILSSNSLRTPAFGSGSPLYLGSRPAAVKTGTTQDFKDAWTVGYTPSLVCGVWTGNNDGTLMYKGSPGVYVAGPIWHDFMSQALAGVDIEQFTKPEPVHLDKSILNGQVKEEKIKICKISHKLAGPFCPEDLVEEKIFKEVHTILYYVDKDNPRGPYPEDPGSDPQFRVWEGTVQAWAKSQEFLQEKPPEEACDVHIKENIPQINITSPRTGENITSNQFVVTAEASAPLEVARVDFYFDDGLQGADKDSPYSFEYNISVSGSHKITVKAYDKVENKGETSINIMTQVPSVSIIQPKANLTLNQTDFPYTIVAQTQNFNQGISKVEFYSASTLIGSTSVSSSNEHSVNWPYPGKGSYQIFARVLGNDGMNIESGRVKVGVE